MLYKKYRFELALGALVTLLRVQPAIGQDLEARVTQLEEKIRQLAGLEEQISVRLSRDDARSKLKDMAENYRDERRRPQNTLLAMPLDGYLLTTENNNTLLQVAELLLKGTTVYGKQLSRTDFVDETVQIEESCDPFLQSLPGLPGLGESLYARYSVRLKTPPGSEYEIVTLFVWFELKRGRFTMNFDVQNVNKRRKEGPRAPSTSSTSLTTPATDTTAITTTTDPTTTESGGVATVVDSYNNTPGSTTATSTGPSGWTTPPIQPVQE